VPLYEYRCTACGKLFEELVRNPEHEQRLACPQCGSQKLERQLSRIATPRGASPTPTPGPCASCAGAERSCPFRGSE